MYIFLVLANVIVLKEITFPVCDFFIFFNFFLIYFFHVYTHTLNAESSWNERKKKEEKNIKLNI